MICEKHLPSKSTYQLHKLIEPPEDDQVLRQKHVEAMVNNDIVQPFGINYYVFLTVNLRIIIVSDQPDAQFLL